MISEKLKHALEFSLIIVILISGTLGIVFSVKAYPDVFKTQTVFEQNGETMNLEDSIDVSFSESMIPESVESGLRISPDTEIIYNWKDKNRNLSIVPKNGWKPETFYQIDIENGKNIMFIETDADFNFETISYPKIQSFSPEQGEKEVLIGIEDPIEIVFDKPLDDFNVKFSIDPNESLVYQLIEDNPKIELMPKGKFEEGKVYNIEVYIKHKRQERDDYKKIYASSFETKLLPPDLSSRDFSTRLAYAKKYTQPQIKEGKYIDIDVKNQIMIIFENGKVLDSFLISSGKKGMDTPQGSFQIHNKHLRPWSRKYSLYMPYWMAFVGSGLYGIHELPEWSSGYKEGQDHLGTPVSHGCVRLGIGSAKKVYNWAEIGTPVIIHD